MKLTGEILTAQLIGIIMFNIVSGFATDTVIREQEIIGNSIVNFDTPMIYKNGKVSLKFTNLLSSDSSVRLVLEKYYESYVNYSPDLPKNFVLAPGESLTGTYTLLDSSSPSNGQVIYDCWTVYLNESATIRLESLILEEGKETPGFVWLTSIISMIFIITASKRKINK